MKRKIEINIDIRKDVPVEQLLEYLNEALSSWGSGYRPEHPLYDGLNIERLRISGKEY